MNIKRGSDVRIIDTNNETWRGRYEGERMMNGCPVILVDPRSMNSETMFVFPKEKVVAITVAKSCLEGF